MEPRVPLLTQLYGAYNYRDIPREDTELTHVGPGTPAGEYLRRFWQPVGYAPDLKDLPVPIRIMGEDLVLFRDRGGRVGLLQRHCAHRGTSLEFGRIEERGIRCCYHGWLYDVSGQILETPGEPRTSTYKDRFCQGAYPTYVFHGMIFAYMGPTDKQPVFPRYDFFDLPGLELRLGPAITFDYNWLQFLENGMDPVHLVFLHTTAEDVQFTASFGIRSVTEFEETPIGVRYCDTRRVGENIWVRIADLILPNIDVFAETDEDGTQERTFGPPEMTLWAVPIDDTHTMRLSFVHQPKGVEKNWEKLFNPRLMQRREDYEERQRSPGDYDAQSGQRPIAIHALEHLASTDRGVILVRKGLREGIRAVSSGNDPKGLVRQPETRIPTRVRNTVLRRPPLADADADRELLREVGRQVVAGLLP